MKKKYELALNEAVAWINNNYDPIGIIASGSIIRENPDKNSDLDIYIIHEDDYRQRIQKYFCGIPCEFFVNNVIHINNYFESEYLENRPVTAHILTTGKVILKNDKVSKIIEKAHDYLNKPLELSPQESLLRRSYIASKLEDVSDLLHKDRLTSLYIMDSLVIEAIKYAFIIIGKPLPRVKERLERLKNEDPELGKLFEEYYSLNRFENKYDVICKIVEKLTSESGFFEWSSKPDYN